MNRRGFLRLLGLGAAATAAGLVLPEAEPVRRFWQVGAQLERLPLTHRDSGTYAALMQSIADEHAAFSGVESVSYPMWKARQFADAGPLKAYDSRGACSVCGRLTGGCCTVMRTPEDWAAQNIDPETYRRWRDVDAFEVGRGYFNATPLLTAPMLCARITAIREDA